MTDENKTAPRPVLFLIGAVEQWKTLPGSQTRFLIAPLPADDRAAILKSLEAIKDDAGWGKAYAAAVAEKCLRGWENVGTLMDGKVYRLPFKPENVALLVQDDVAANFIINTATGLGSRLAEETAEAGNALSG